MPDVQQASGMAHQDAHNRQKVLALDIAGVRFELRAAATAYLPDYEALLVADLHLEKGSAYAERGQMLPPYDSAATASRLMAEMDELRPKIVISLGDSFHDQAARRRMSAEVVDAVRAMTGATDWVWICGNHDVSPPDDLGGRIALEEAVGPLILRHEPIEGPVIGEVAGHLHPCARVGGGVRSVRAKCFATDGQRLVMPSFGALTGGLNVRDPAFAPLFPKGVDPYVIGRDGVYAVRRDRLIADRAKPSRLAG